MLPSNRFTSSSSSSSSSSQASSSCASFNFSTTWFSCNFLMAYSQAQLKGNEAGPLEAFGRVAWQLLQDVQERLVFRAHCYLQSDILQYKPAAGDLAYPEKLEMMESIAQSLQEQAALSLRRSESRSSLASIGSATSQEVARINSDSNTTVEQPRSRTGNSPADLHGMWYPTVRRTLVCLSRLYRCVDRPIFQGLSQEALTMCIQSVASAAQAISNKKSPTDGELFQIKHLLILREQIAPFQVDFTIKEMSLDFSKVKTAAFGLLHKRKRLFSLGTNNALLEFLLEGTPTVREQLVDSRKEVDKQLKASCEAFIQHTTKTLAGPLLTFLDRGQVFVSMQTEVAGNVTLAQQPFAHADVIGKIVQETQRLIKNQLPIIQRSMQLYLANRETEFILFRPIKNNVVASFVQLQQLLAGGGYTSDDLLLAGCPSPEQVTVLLSSASLLGTNQVSNTTTTVVEEELHT
ncbi:conserved oligomeric Golgi complex subunit 3 [Cryptotermes secundus]|nr:conserved oligomeric Golgi complex subunit 3 [Cryptotermes secundus]